MNNKEIFDGKADILDSLPIIKKNYCQIRSNAEVLTIQANNGVSYITPEEQILGKFKNERAKENFQTLMSWFALEIENIDAQFKKIKGYYEENKQNFEKLRGTINIFDKDLAQTYKLIKESNKYKQAVFNNTENDKINLGFTKSGMGKRTHGLEIQVEPSKRYTKFTNPYIDYGDGGVSDLNFVFDCLEKHIRKQEKLD